MSISRQNSRSIPTVILVGGLGTRLGQLTADTPKPLIYVGNQPFLEILLWKLGRHGITEIILLAGFQHKKITAFTKISSAIKTLNLQVDVLVEPFKAGTGGALWHARNHLPEQFLLLNGDSWFDFDLSNFIAEALQDGQEWLTKLAIRQLPDTSRYGTVLLQADRIISFKTADQQAKPGLVNAGVYFIKSAIFDLLSPDCSLEQDILPKLAVQNLLIGKVYEGFFIDIGIPEDLSRAQYMIGNKRQRPADF